LEFWRLLKEGDAGNHGTAEGFYAYIQRRRLVFEALMTKVDLSENFLYRNIEKSSEEHREVSGIFS
jgi:hypothetical protein